MNKHFTILELGSDAESPMIGTVDYISNTKTGKESFKKRFIKAVCEHFDIKEFNHDEIPDLFAGSPYEDIMIEFDGLNHEIRIIETWMY